MSGMLGLLCKYEVNKNTYKLKQFTKLGEGNQGVVFKVQSQSNKQQYALKIFETPKYFSKRDQIRILQATNTCPNIIRTIDYEFKDEKLYIVMQLGQRSLEDYLSYPEPNTLSRSQIVNLVRCLIKGIETIHSNAIVHMDIKPSNIILVKQVSSKDESPVYVYKISDMGISRLASRISLSNNGTQPYKAPEVRLVITESGHHMFDAADIWSFGVVIFRAYFGFMLFNSQNYEKEMDQNNIKQLTGRGLDIGLLSSWLKESIRNSFRSKLKDTCQSLLKIITKAIHYRPTQRATFQEIKAISLGQTIKYLSLSSKLTEENADRQMLIGALSLELQQLRYKITNKERINQLVNQALNMIKLHIYHKNNAFGEVVLELYKAIKKMNQDGQIIYNSVKRPNQIFEVLFMLLVSSDTQKFMGSRQKLTNFYITNKLKNYALWQYPCDQEVVNSLEWVIIVVPNK